MTNIANSELKDKFTTCQELLKKDFPILSQYVGNQRLASQLNQILPAIPKSSSGKLSISFLLLDLTLKEQLIPILTNDDAFRLLEEILEDPKSYYEGVKEAEEALAEQEQSFKPFYLLEKIRSLLFTSHEINLRQKDN